MASGCFEDRKFLREDECGTWTDHDSNFGCYLLPRKLKTLGSFSKVGRFDYQLSLLLCDDGNYLPSLGLGFLTHKMKITFTSQNS